MARITSRVLTIAAAVAAFGLLAPVTAGASTGNDYTPGAPGAGDPYFPDMGNGGYDAQHYSLSLKYDPATKAIDAVAKISARTTQNLSQFDLDFLGPFNISKVTVNGRAASYTRTGAQELVIAPDQLMATGEDFIVEVAYSGVPQLINDPSLGVAGWIATHDGAVTLSQPYGSATWYPVNDTTHDKATYDFTVTVPTGLQVLANGDPAGEVEEGSNTTFRWIDSEPTSSELVLMAIGHFDVSDTRTASGLRNITAVDPAAVQAGLSSAATADQTEGRGQRRTAPLTAPADDFNKTTADVAEWAQNLYGTYPFSSVGGIDVLAPNVGYSMETQTRPVYAKGSPGALPSASLISHELAHQWFGNSVTPNTWQDMWLNESFATYTEWLYSEQHGGQTVQQIFDAAYNSASRNWSGKVADPGRDHIFDDLVYTRGAMTLHQLRLAIGDTAFFKLVKEWPAAYRYGNATTAQFMAFAQQYTQTDLSPLFQTWLYTEGKPAL
ncbi:M1 family metallopeptidase [Streptomyces spiralis]